VVSQFGFPHRDPEAFGEEFRHGFRSLSQNSTLFAKKNSQNADRSSISGRFSDFYGISMGF